MNKEHIITITDIDGIAQEFTVDLEKPFIIGRSQKCDVPYPQDGLSREHLKVHFEQNKFIVTDLGGVNGTYVDEKKVENEKTAEVYSFSQVRIANLYVLDLNFDDLPTNVSENNFSVNSTFDSFSTTSKPKPETTLQPSFSTSSAKKSSRKTRTNYKRRNNVINMAMILLLFGGTVFLNKERIIKLIKKKKDVQKIVMDQEENEINEFEQESQTEIEVPKKVQLPDEEKNTKSIIAQIDADYFSQNASCNTELKNKFCNLFTVANSKSYGVILEDKNLKMHIDYNRFRLKNIKYFNSKPDQVALIISKFKVDTLKYLKEKNINLFEVFLTTPVFKKFKTVKYIKVDLESFFQSIQSLTTFNNQESASGAITFTDKESFLKMQQAQAEGKEMPKKEVTFKQVIPYLQRSISINP